MTVDTITLVLHGDRPGPYDVEFEGRVIVSAHPFALQRAAAILRKKGYLENTRLRVVHDSQHSISFEQALCDVGPPEFSTVD